MVGVIGVVEVVGLVGEVEVVGGSRWLGWLGHTLLFSSRLVSYQRQWVNDG